MRKTKKDVRKWQMNKLAGELLAIVMFVVGLGIFIQAFLSQSVTQDSWKFITGIALMISATFIWVDVYPKKYKRK